MPIYRGDTLIRELRKSKGLTLKELSEGICSLDSLSRIERGQRRPDWYIFERLMQRLGENPRKYYSDVATAEEKKIIDQKDAITELLRKKTAEGDEQARRMVARLETDGNYKEGINRQFLLRARSILAFHEKHYQSMYDYAAEGLKITIPEFDEEKIDTYALSFDEIKLVNQIAVARNFLTSMEKSTEILLKLKSAVDKGYADGEEKAKTYISLLYNITKNLGLLKKHDEAIALCDDGIALCQKHRDSFYHPLFLINKGSGFIFLDKKAEGAGMLKTARSLLRGFNRLSELETLENYANTEFGIKL
ncbi:MAG: helix-turn-helix transcriptional regulator [Clostridiales bacterium]|nr:helix-turn-helix transcriptional regulator [Clostridiales bacterium]